MVYKANPKRPSRVEADSQKGMKSVIGFINRNKWSLETCCRKVSSDIIKQ